MGTPRTLTLPQGGRNRPMPGANADAALQSLQRMNSISNVGGLTNRGLDIAQGYDQFEPSEADLIGAQLQARGPAQPSREQLRESAMSKVKQLLGMSREEHAQEMEEEALKVEAAAQQRAAQNEAIAERQREAAEFASQRQSATSAATDARAAAGREAQMAALDKRLAAQEAGGGSTRRLPTEGMDKRLADARAGFQGFHPMNSLQRFLGMRPSADTVYQSALESVLERKGTLGPLGQLATEAKAEGMTAQMAIAEAAQQGVQLDSQEQEYLTLLLGQ